MAKKYLSNKMEKYHLATLWLLKSQPQAFRYNELPYDEFETLIYPLLDSEDFSDTPISPGNPRTEVFWRNRFRWALGHMLKDGRVARHARGEYEITAKGLDYLESRECPEELVTEEIVDLESGETVARYSLPDGTVTFEVETNADS
jgi:Mrr N-terminal domain